MTDLVSRMRAAATAAHKKNEGNGSGIWAESAACNDLGAATIAELRAEVERLRHRNAALVEIVAESRCPYDGRAAVAECQQCGCSHGLLIKPLASEQSTREP